MKGDKGIPFQQSFTMLGEFLVSNKPGRLERTQRLVQQAKRRFPPLKHDMQVIAGLLQYAVGNSLGATLRMASRLCSAMAAGHYPINFRKYALGPLI